MIHPKALSIVSEVRKAVVGKDPVICKVLMAILAQGHILLEDNPGVGKTTLALAFSKAMDLAYNRIQFTPEVMPADVVGFSVYSRVTGKFEYRPGAALCNLLLADEITPDSCRLWDQRDGSGKVEHLDKDLFRRDLGDIIPAYEEIESRLAELAKSEGIEVAE